MGLLTYKLLLSPLQGPATLAEATRAVFNSACQSGRTDANSILAIKRGLICQKVLTQPKSIHLQTNSVSDSRMWLG